MMNQQVKNIITKVILKNKPQGFLLDHVKYIVSRPSYTNPIRGYFAAVKKIEKLDLVEAIELTYILDNYTESTATILGINIVEEKIIDGFYIYFFEAKEVI